MISYNDGHNAINPIFFFFINFCTYLIFDIRSIDERYY